MWKINLVCNGFAKIESIQNVLHYNVTDNRKIRKGRNKTYVDVVSYRSFNKRGGF